MATPKDKKVKVTCLGDDCNTEVDITYEDGIPTGTCTECGLNMGAVLNRHRHEKALQKLRDGSSGAQQKKERRNDFDF